MAFFIADFIALLSAYTIMVVIRGELGGEALWQQYFGLLPFLAVVPLLIRAMDLYPGVLLNPVEEFRRLTIAIALGMSLVVVATFLLKAANTYSRVIFVAVIPLAVGLTLSARWAVRKALSKVGWWNIPTVLVGPGDETEVLKRLIEANPTVGIRVVAVIDSSCTQLPFRAKEFEQGAIPYAFGHHAVGGRPEMAP